MTTFHNQNVSKLKQIAQRLADQGFKAAVVVHDNVGLGGVYLQTDATMRQIWDVRHSSLY